MNIVAIVGDPDKVCDFLGTMVSSGYHIDIVKKTKNNATYIVGYSAATAGEFLLLEDGSYPILRSVYSYAI